MRRHRKLLRRHRHHHKTLVPARPIPPVGDGSSSTGAAGLPVASAAGGGASAHSADSGPTAVGSAPFGPAAPSGGWAVEYADAFGAPLGTVPGEDNTVWPSRFTGNCTNNPGFNGNEMEVFNCSQVSTDANGLELKCSYAPNIAAGKNYNCGAIETEGQDHPAGYRLFNFEPGHGQEWALQIVTKFPPNSGEADPGWWASTPTWAWEWDMFEGFGSEGGKGGGWCSGNYVGTTDPTFISSPNGSNSTGGESYLCRDQGFDPSAGYHTYTTVYYPNNTMSEWIDGRPVTWSYEAGQSSTVLSVGSPPAVMGGLILSYALRNTTVGAADPYFSSGTRYWTTRSIAVYENATAGGANTINPEIAPGTRVG